MNLKRVQRNNILIQILLFALLIAADRITKVLAVSALKDQPDRPVLEDVLVLHYLENQGAAFGIFENSTWIFAVAAVAAFAAALIIFIYMNRKLGKYIQLPSDQIRMKTVRNVIFLDYLLTILAAGAVGNLIDRLLHGYVIDFIYIKIIRFPVFNIADIFVTCSVIILIIYIIFIYKEDVNFKQAK